MALYQSIESLGVTSAIDLCAIDNSTPPPMDNAVSALGINEISPNASADFNFIRSMGGPSI